MDISVVVPARDEEASIATLVGETAKALDGFRWEMIIVDDGSVDRTWAAILEASSSYPVKGVRFGRSMGKAAALSAGFAEASGSLVATMDADLQDDPAELPAMASMMAEGNLDLVSGWKKTRHDPLSKRIPSKVFNCIVRLATGLRLHDFNCGLKLYRGETARRLDLYGEMHRYTPVLVAQLGYRVGEKAVNHRPRRHGRSKYGLSRFFRGYADLLTVLFLHRYSFRPLHFFGGIGTTLFATGLAITAYLSVLWLGGESIGNRPLLLMGVFLMLIGFQLVSLGLLGEMMLRFLPGKKPFNIVERSVSGTQGTSP
ncbi:MAG: glycosyltransferase family 2 protein [Candidatus Fermentibacter sp.]|nr:glycosyltransferase family 2 protein [Candidatus Fermentibacter sp.]